MKAIRFDGVSVRLADVPVPEQGDEALVRVVRSGICNTDLEIVRGYAGFTGTIGHEFVGIVERCPGNPELVQGRVVGEINAGCGSCDHCQSGDSRHCPQRTVLGIVGRDGCHAEFLSLPARNLRKVPDSVSDEAAVFTEPLAAAWGITELVEFKPETRVAVIGDGKLGTLCAWSLALKVQHLCLFGKHQSKLSAAEKGNVEGLLVDQAGGFAAHFDVVVEASGAESGLAAALDLVRPRGTVVLKSTFHGKAAWDAWKAVVNEVRVVGSRCGRFEPALHLLEAGKVEVEKLISDEFTLSEGLNAIDRAAEPGAGKVQLKM